MAIKKASYNKDEAKALRNSAIPAAVMASEGTRFDSADDASVFLPASWITSRLSPTTLSTRSLRL